MLIISELESGYNAFWNEALHNYVIPTHVPTECLYFIRNCDL